MEALLVVMLRSPILIDIRKGGEKEGANRARQCGSTTAQQPVLSGRDLGLSGEGLAPMMPTDWSPRPIPRRLVSPASRDCGAMHEALVAAARVADRLPRPGPSTGTVAQWTGTIANLSTDYADERTRVKPSTPSPAALDRSVRVFNLVFKLRGECEFSAYVVVARAVGVTWKQITALDPKRRSRQFLALLRSSAVQRLVELDRAAGGEVLGVA